MKTEELIEIARECGNRHAYTIYGYHPFSLTELQQFAQRIEQPLQGRITRLIDTLNAKDKQIEQLREALQALYDEQNGPPLIRHAARWEAAMQLSSNALEQTK